jgi:outer membrane protein TolC
MSASMPRLLGFLAFGLIFGGALAVSTVAQTEAPVVSLSEVVRAALAQNRDLQQAQAEVDKAAQSVETARANRLPRFNVSFIEPVLLSELDLRLGPISLGLPNNFAFALGTVSQPISQLHDIGLGIRAASLSRDAASERLRSARQEVVNRVRRAYYACLRAESGLRPAREAVELFRELERVVGTLVEERAALAADLLDVQVRRARQEHDVLALENALSTGREQVNVALARDPDTRFAFEPIPLSVPADIDVSAAKARLLEQRPDIRQARLSVELARLDVRLKKAEQRPRVAALFGYVGSINMPLLPGNIASAVVQASWEPFDWGRKSREVAVKELTARQAETAVRQLEAVAGVELSASVRALREARSLVSVTELGERAARERLRVMLDRSNEGVVLTKDLLQAQVALAEADHAYQDALLAYWEARANYEKAAGEDPQ